MALSTRHTVVYTNLFDLKRLGLEGRHVDLLEAFFALSEGATGQLAALVSHEVAAVSEG